MSSSTSIDATKLPIGQSHNDTLDKEKQQYVSDIDVNNSDVYDEENNHARLDRNSAAHFIPWKYKCIALLCVVSLPSGQTWTGASLGPLKNTLRKEFNISNTQFRVISASNAIVNSIWPIIGGSVLAALASNLELWRLLADGHIFMGFGIAMLDSATQKFFYRWFGAGARALAFGFESTVSSTVDLVAGMVTVGE